MRALCGSPVNAPAVWACGVCVPLPAPPGVFLPVLCISFTYQPFAITSDPRRKMRVYLMFYTHLFN